MDSVILTILLNSAQVEFGNFKFFSIFLLGLIESSESSPEFCAARTGFSILCLMMLPSRFSALLQDGYRSKLHIAL
jgi:hypothetical protein